MKRELSNVQKQIYNYCELYPKDPSYNITVLCEIQGKFDKERFKVISEICLNNIDVSKVNIAKEGNLLVNNYDETHSICIEEKDCSDKSGEEFRDYVISVAREARSKPIDMKKWPLMNVVLFSHTDKEHMILFNIHHIIADVYSFYSIIDRVCIYYNSDKTIGEIADEEKSSERIQYLDVLDKVFGNGAADIDYFKSIYQEGESIELKKLSQNRNSDGMIKGHKCVFELDKELSEKIRSYIKDNRITDFAFFLAIYILILKKVTMEDSIVTGIPLGNRTKREMKDVFGYFVNTLPLKIVFSEDMTFNDLCDTVLEKSFSLMRHQSFDLSQLNNWVTGRLNNVFTFYKQAMLLNLKDCETRLVDFGLENVMFELTGRAEAADNYKIEFEYGEFFDDVNIEEMYNEVVHQAVVNMKIKDISLTADTWRSEYANINSYIADRKYDTVKSIFEKTAAINSDGIAVKYGDDEYTYKELNEISNQVADKLLKNYPEHKQIAFSLNRKKELLALIMGIIKAGKTYVPIDTMSPVKRSQYILNDLGNVTYIAEKEIAERIGTDSSANVISYDDFFSDISGYSSENPEIELDDPGLYMIYTSGSTGNPKGVTIKNNNLISLMTSTQKKYKFDNNDVWTLFHSYGFDFSVWEIFGCLLSGGKLIVIDPNICKSVDQFYEIVHKEKVTVLNQTPTAFKSFIKCDSQAKKELNIRYVIFGGEALYFNSLKDWVGRHPLENTKLINMYGITETTIHVTYYEVTNEDIQSNNKSVIGLPLDNLGVYVVDEDMNILPQGITGELLVYGDGVSCGYYNKSELTEEKFTVLPQTGQRIYKSGDLARINKDGMIEYLGRKDKQIQLRGFRIELGEIENVIMREFDLKVCSVQVINYGENDDRIVAFMEKNKICDEKADMTGKLKQALPYYMIPSEYVGVDSIPMTINGKVDVDKLVSEMKKTEQKEVVITFKNKNEENLYNIIKDVSGIGNFKISDNLFDVGITSVHLSAIYNKIQEKYSLDNFNLIDLFSYPSIEKLSALIDSQKKEKSRPGRRNVSRAELRRAQRGER